MEEAVVEEGSACSPATVPFLTVSSNSNNNYKHYNNAADVEHPPSVYLDLVAMATFRTDCEKLNAFHCLSYALAFGPSIPLMFGRSIRCFSGLSMASRPVPLYPRDHVVPSLLL